MSQRRGGQPKRRTSGAARRPSILVFTEGLKTEPIYLAHWRRIFRDRIIVTVDEFHGPPLKLVEAAASRRTADLREARRGRGDAYSDYWCVFDIDEHPYVDRALELAAASGISVAVSNPCIELWFILHFENQTAVIDRGDAQRKSSGVLKFEKTPTPAALGYLVSRYEDARYRAKALDEKHRLDGSPPRSNPSSGAWCLIDQIRQPGR